VKAAKWVNPARRIEVQQVIAARADRAMGANQAAANQLLRAFKTGEHVVNHMALLLAEVAVEAKPDAGKASRSVANRVPVVLIQHRPQEVVVLPSLPANVAPKKNAVRNAVDVKLPQKAVEHLPKTVVIAAGVIERQVVRPTGDIGRRFEHNGDKIVCWVCGQGRFPVFSRVNGGWV
jgi:hypothetical protein